MHRINASIRRLLFGTAVLGIVIAVLHVPRVLGDEPGLPLIESAMTRAGGNAAELQKALQATSGQERRAVIFLINNMPESDLRTLPADYLLEHAEYACRAWNESPWGDEVDEQLFLNNVLPYASVNERRDAWRKDFYERFKPMVEGIDSPGEAAAKLNNEIFKELGVKYSRRRKKPDQSPYETMESGLASCTGLSILLIDACRSVGVPARFAGTALWSDGSGNHSWVEVWDGRWRFTGAAEPKGMELNKGWFIGRASRAVRDDPRHAIYATSFRRTPLSFPMVWAVRDTSVPAVNVTDRYLAKQPATPEGHTAVRFQVVEPKSGQRVSVGLRIEDSTGATLFTGLSKDERFDGNDHLTFTLRSGEEYKVASDKKGVAIPQQFTATGDEQLITLSTPSKQGPVDRLRVSLAEMGDGSWTQPAGGFAGDALSREEAAEAESLLWSQWEQFIKRDRAEEMESRKIVLGEQTMPFAYKVFGDEPESGRSLYISMHGGGGAPEQVNTQQWRNQQNLYQPQEGVYLAPRAPTDTWNLWHRPQIDSFFERLIANLIVFENVNPDRVYVMGYSAGGDGAFQLAPRMADRWAAAAMMAGHPGDASPLNLRNIGFALYMGGQDRAYKRNEHAAKWKVKLAELRAQDPEAYDHIVTIYPDKGHWMDREDASALPWMAEHTRNPYPQKIVWRQDNRVHERFYWLSVDTDAAGKNALITATRKEQHIDLVAEGVSEITVMLNDAFIDLDKPVRITSGDRVLFSGKLPRTIASLSETLEERGDPHGVFSASVTVRLDGAEEEGA